MSAITTTSARGSSPQPMRSGSATPKAVDSVESAASRASPHRPAGTSSPAPDLSRARSMAKDRLLLTLLLAMLIAAIGIAALVIVGAVEDCGPDGDCTSISSPGGVVLKR